MRDIPEQAIQAAYGAYVTFIEEGGSVPVIDAVRAALTAARPFLSGQAAVKKLEWELVSGDHYAEGYGTHYNIYETKPGLWNSVTVKPGNVRLATNVSLEDAKAAAQADYEARILSALEPSAARSLALEEAARVCDAKIVSMQAHYDQTDNPFIRSNLAGDIALISHLAAAIRALSSPDHNADAGKVEGDGWLPIESAPKNKAIQIYIPNADYYGNDGIYAGILVDLGTGQRWATFGWAVARDLPPHMHPTRWRPLPSAPASEGAE